MKKIYLKYIILFSFTLITSTACNKTICQPEIYVPEEVMIYEPDLAEIDYGIPLCFYNNFSLKWNKDEKNNNGIFLVVEWYGNTFHGDSVNNTYVKHVDCVPDNGECLLNEKLFEDIPDYALCNIYIARGDAHNMNYVLNNGFAYKFRGIAFAVFAFILVRNQ